MVDISTGWVRLQVYSSLSFRLPQESMVTGEGEQNTQELEDLIANELASVQNSTYSDQLD